MSNCGCMRPDCPGSGFDRVDLGTDTQNGRYGKVQGLTCIHCGSTWLRYFVTYEGFSRSGRWYRGQVSAEQASATPPEQAVEVLTSLPWHFRGGSYFDSAGERATGPLRVDL